jgi:hypothetical protein
LQYSPKGTDVKGFCCAPVSCWAVRSSEVCWLIWKRAGMLQDDVIPVNLWWLHQCGTWIDMSSSLGGNMVLDVCKTHGVHHKQWIHWMSHFGVCQGSVICLFVVSQLICMLKCWPGDVSVYCFQYAVTKIMWSVIL